MESVPQRSPTSNNENKYASEKREVGKLWLEMASVWIVVWIFSSAVMPSADSGDGMECVFVAFEVDAVN